jgi:hypothetical protein
VIINADYSFFGKAKSEFHQALARRVHLRRAELETAKEILAKVFHDQPADREVTRKDGLSNIDKIYVSYFIILYHPAT